MPRIACFFGLLFFGFGVRNVFWLWQFGFFLSQVRNICVNKSEVCIFFSIQFFVCTQRSICFVLLLYVMASNSSSATAQRNSATARKSQVAVAIALTVCE